MGVTSSIEQLTCGVGKDLYWRVGHLCALERVPEGSGDKRVPRTRLGQKEEVDVEEAYIAEHWDP